MGYQVLARKYRPQRFADVAGQDHVTRTLLNALAQNRIAHGYIFSGHRGIGKTTIARILAKALNCRNEIGADARPTPEPCDACDACVEIRQGNAVDVIEIDAATNRGIDEIRELRDAARYAPSRDRYKIYILDEAHQITEAAFNALLKTLEEPPAHVVFMMATTEPENIPQTIRSRCQHFSFHAVRFDDILIQLRAIAVHENVTAEEDALALLAEAGDGSMRDALSIMDQAIASAPFEDGRAVLAAGQIRDLMGSVPNAVFERLLEAVAAGSSAEVMSQLNTLLNAGHSPSSLARQLVRFLRNTLMSRLGGEQTQLLQVSTDERARAARTALLFSEEELTRNLQIVLRTFDDLNHRQEQRFHLELGLLKLIHAQRLIPLEELLSGFSTSSGARASIPPLRAAPPAPAPSGSRTAPPASAVRASTASAGRASAAPDTVSPSISPFGPSSGSWPPIPRLGIDASPASMQSPVAAEALSRGLGAGLNAIGDRPAPGDSGDSAASSAQPAKPNGGYGNVTPITAGALAMAPRPDLEPAAAPSIEAIRDAACAALVEAGHLSAAQLLGAAQWTLDGAGLRIEAQGIGKKMLALTVSAGTEKLIRKTLQGLGAPTRFLVVCGEGQAAAEAAASTLISGGARQAALSHPMVQRTAEVFNAEVLSVIDLRQKP